MARILIVDDSPTEMYKLTGMLEKHGHQVLKAENGADGVKRRAGQMGNTRRGTPFKSH